MAYISMAKAAKRLRLQIPTVDRLRREDKLDGRRFGRQWRISEASITHYLRAPAPAPAPAPPSAPRPFNWPKMVWYLEEMARKLHLEGYVAEHDLLLRYQIAEAISARDKLLREWELYTEAELHTINWGKIVWALEEVVGLLRDEGYMDEGTSWRLLKIPEIIEIREWQQQYQS
jgi:excisionase family DNA binding protein